MSQLSDALDFEKFFLKDLWSGIKKDPKRLVLGVDPASTWTWNKVLGRDDEPLVDQLGGPYGGKFISTGDPDGGVYGRARAAGINTAPAAGMHDVAHSVAAMFGAQGLGGAIGNIGGGGAQPGLWDQGFSGAGGFGGTSGAGPSIPGIAGPVGGNPGMTAGLTGMDYAKLGMSAMSGQPEQQQPPPQAPVRPMAQPKQVPTFGQRIASGFGRVGDALFPVDPNSGMAPDQQKALQRQALMQMGLGMMSASNQGAGFGQALASGFGQASTNMQGAMQRAYENAMRNRAETRAERREEREDARADRDQAFQQWQQEHTLDRERVSDERYASERDFELKQADQSQKRWEAEMKAQADWRNAQIAGVTKSPEVRVTDRGMFERDPKTGEWKLVPGTEPSGIAGRPIPQGIADDLKGNAQVIGMIDEVLPLLKTPDGKGAVGARNAWIDFVTPDAISDNVKNKVDPEGTQTRAIITNLNSFIVKQRNGAAVTVAEFARQRGFLPTDRDDPATAEKKLTNLRKALESEQQYILDFVESQGYRAPPTSVRGGGLGQQAPAVRKSVGGRNYVQVNGQWYEDDGSAPGQ